ncbi:anti-sigma factor [Actinoplanes sp. NPDC049596]|uniref:anti-sigma factor n=1 Tax=unclassified Actinoplanes TaxID=2626549 RepID=UPI0034159772
MTTEIHTLLGPYVLDAVDDLERAAFDRHLRECAECRAEVDELREATARLGGATWSVPPPRLRENVLAEIGRTRQLPPVAEKPPTAFRWRRLTAAAAVVVAVAGAGAVAYEVQDQRVRTERATAEAARAGEARVRAILTAPDLTVREEALTTGGRLTVASSGMYGAGVVMLAADGSAPDGKVYQLWTLRPNTAPASAGVLEPGQAATVQLVEGLAGVTGVAVTVEPPKGSTAPTTTPIGDVTL